MVEQIRISRPADSDAENIGVRIVELFEDIQGVHYEELPSLYDTIDTEVVADLLEHTETELMVQFRYGGHVVRIHGDERIEVGTPPAEKERL